MEHLAWILPGLTLLVLVAGIAISLRRGSGGALRRELEDLRQQLQSVSEAGREQSRSADIRTEQILSASREELGRNAALLRAEVDGKLGKLQETAGQLVQLSKGVHDLHALLQTPGGRGSFGEMTLEKMLADLFGEFGEMYEMQHVLPDGERVDAAIFIKPDRSVMLCVDAKFPLAHATALLDGTGGAEETRAFAKDVRERAEEIRKKYLRPPKTLDFALMFVPSEAVYYLVLKDHALHEELLRKRVVPTSPNSFYAYLHALSAAFRGIKIEEKSAELQKGLVRVGKDFETFADAFRRMGEHLRRARGAFEETELKLERFRGKIERMTQGEVPESKVQSPEPGPESKSPESTQGSEVAAPGA